MQSCPIEVLSHIASYMPVTDVFNLTFRVCKRLKVLLPQERGVNIISGNSSHWHTISWRGVRYSTFNYPRLGLIYQFTGLVTLELCHSVIYDPIEFGLWRLAACKSIRKIVITAGRRLFIRPLTEVEKKNALVPCLLCYGPNHCVMDVRVTFPGLKWLELLDDLYTPKELYITQDAIDAFKLTERCISTWTQLHSAYLLENLPLEIEFVDFGSYTPSTLGHLALYSSITRLNIETSYDIFFQRVRDAFPSVATNLTFLNWTNSYDDTFLGNMATFGSSLRNLTCLKLWTTEIILWDQYGGDFPNLKTLAFRRCCITYQGAQTMPTSLTCLIANSVHSLRQAHKEIKLTQLSTVFIEPLGEAQDNPQESNIYRVLPRNLRQLVWKDQNKPLPCDLSDFPKNLTSLLLSEGSEDNSKHKTELIAIPDTVTSLDVTFSPKPKMLAALPRNLTSLTCHGFHLKTATALKDLPEQLTELNLHHVYLPPDAFKVTPLPKYLKRLILFVGRAYVSDEIFPYLPRHLEELQLPHSLLITGAVLQSGTTVVSEEVLLEAILQALPPPLTEKLRVKMCASVTAYAKLNHMPTGKPTFHLSKMPSSVTKLNLTSDILEMDQLDKTHLRTIVLKDVTKDKHRFAIKNCAGGKLESLHLGFTGEIRTHQLVDLPKTLVELCLPNIMLNNTPTTACFPPTLKILTVRFVDVQAMELLVSPSEIVTLTVTHGTMLHAAHFAAMPRRLTHLRLGTCSCSQCDSELIKSATTPVQCRPLAKSTLNALPTTLTVLETGKLFQISGAQISQLCTHMPSLRLLQVHNVSATLEDLSSVHPTRVILPGDARRQLEASLPNSLLLKATQFSIAFTDNDSEQLPDTLKELTLEQHQDGISDTFFNNLPMKLTTLNLFQQRGFTHKNLSYLPPTLTHLSIVAKNIKETGFKNLPKSLQHLHLIGPTASLANLKLGDFNALRILLMDAPSGLKSAFFISRLPTSLTTLEIGAINNQLAPESAPKLPAHLLCLCLYGAGPELCTASFPKSLKTCIVRSERVDALPFS